jgi:beta-N-acetylhexosaminidase
MTKNQKIAQCFSPAAFIHDTEENYQAIELPFCRSQF